MTRLEQELLQFLNDHEHVISNAVSIYARDMTEIAKEAQAGYDSIKDDPGKVAAQDQSMMTTNGLRISAQMFRDAAQQAQRALDALEKLAENAEGLE